MSSSEDKIKALSQRFNKNDLPEVEKIKEIKPIIKEVAIQKSKRTRTSIYFNKSTLEAVGKTFNKIQYDLYPTKLDKADYWEALISYALNHQDDLKQEIKKGLGDKNKF